MFVEFICICGAIRESSRSMDYVQLEMEEYGFLLFVVGCSGFVQLHLCGAVGQMIVILISR